MSDRVAEVIYGLASQTVKIYPPEAILGVPSSVTCTVYDGDRTDDDTADFTPTVTVDAVSTTIATTAAGYSAANKRLCTVASTTGLVVGTRYLLTNASGQSEIVEVAAIPSVAVTLRDDLLYEYPITTSTLKGIELSIPIDDTWAATESNINSPLVPSTTVLGNNRTGWQYTPDYRVRLQYTIASVVRRYQCYLRLVRHQFKSGVTGADLKKRWPNIDNYDPATARGADADQAWAISAAEDIFRRDLAAHDLRPDQIDDTELTAQNLIPLALWAFSDGTGSAPGRDPAVYRKERLDEYHLAFNKTVLTLKVPVNQGTGGGTEVQPRQQLWFK